MRGKHGVPPGGRAVRHRPVAVRKAVLIRRVLDHTVQRDVFEESELAHVCLRFSLTSISTACNYGASARIGLASGGKPCLMVTPETYTLPISVAAMCKSYGASFTGFRLRIRIPQEWSD